MRISAPRSTPVAARLYPQPSQKQIWFSIEAGFQAPEPTVLLRMFFRQALKSGRWSALKALPPTDYVNPTSHDAGEVIRRDLRRDFDAVRERYDYSSEMEMVSRLSPMQGFLITLE